MKLLSLDTTAMIPGTPIKPAEPLWKRAPTRNSDGVILSDFMMVIPKLKHKPLHVIKYVIREIERVLTYYEKQIVFADLNLKLNILWVTVQPVPGICADVAAAIHHRVPEAKLIASKIN